MPKRILINFPTNIGDTVLTFPAFDLVRASWPGSQVIAIVSPKTKDFLSRHTSIDEYILYDKRWALKQRVRFFISMRGPYDLIVDFKNSLLPIFLRVPRRTPFIRRFPPHLHLKERYIKLFKNLVTTQKCPKGDFTISKAEQQKWDSYGLRDAIFIATSSHSSLKVYPLKQLKKIIHFLKSSYKIILLGDSQAKDYYADAATIPGVIDLTGKTTFSEVYYLLKNFSLLCIAVDSSILHLASYLDVPVVAIFGATAQEKYGPWSREAKVIVREDIACRPCGRSSCSLNSACMDIEAEQVIKAVEEMRAHESA